MKKFRYVITTQDWHTCDHSSFQPFGGRWPVHCVARTRGARLHPRLDTTRIFFRIKKGTSQKADGYSGFEAAVLAQKLSEWGIVRLFLTGVATEYCVKATALDGLRAGFQVVVLKDLVRSIRAEDGRRALSEIERAGGKVLSGSLF